LQDCKIKFTVKYKNIYNKINKQIWYNVMSRRMLGNKSFRCVYTWLVLLRCSHNRKNKELGIKNKDFNLSEIGYTVSDKLISLFLIPSIVATPLSIHCNALWQVSMRNCVRASTRWLIDSCYREDYSIILVYHSYRPKFRETLLYTDINKKYCF